MSGVSGRGNAARKTLSVPSLSRSMNMTEEQAKNTWAKLEAAIEKIHEQNASSLSFEELYRHAYNMVLHRWAKLLYGNMEDSLARHLQNMTTQLESYTDMAYMRELLERWRAYHKSTQLIRDILMYLDKTYVKSFHLTPVYQRGMDIWAEQVVCKDPAGSYLKNLFLQQVEKERSGETVARDVLTEFTGMMLVLGRPVYTAELEKPYLAASRSHFEADTQRLLATMDCPAYFQAVEARLHAEEERCGALLEAAVSTPKVAALLLEAYVTQTKEQVLEMDSSGAVALLDADRITDLARVYRLLARTPPANLKYFRGLVMAHAAALGKGLVAEAEASRDAVAFTQKVLDLRAKFMRVIAEACNSDKLFLQSLHSTFEGVLNAFPKAAEYISLFIDSKLKKGLGGSSDAAADALLDAVLQIFRYLNDKDMFERFYKQHLSRRLLAGRAAGEALETTMLQKLKTECGYQFTCKLEGMFTDMKTSADTMAAFKRHVADSAIELPVDLSVQVLTTGSWPAASGAQCELPPSLEAGKAAFEAFYRAKHSGRKLTWHAQLGTADLHVVIRGQRHTINVTTHQMCVLMALNATPCPTFKDLLTATRIERDDLKPALIGLSMVKGKMLLKKSPAGKEIGDGDTFAFNEGFKSSHLRIKFQAAGAQKEADVAAGVRQRVEEDRKHVLEAALVRLLKARRRLDYNSVVTSVTADMQGRFVPVPADIKKRLESLIERDFLERDPDDRTVYRYIS